MQNPLEDMLDGIDKKVYSTTCSVQEIRLPLFAPVKQVTHNSHIYENFINNKKTRKVKTQWGSVNVKNFILTQKHRDILDLIALYSKNIKRLEDGRIALSFSISKILKAYEDSGNNYVWFRSILEELMGAVIMIIDSKGKKYYFHIISAMKFDERGDFAGIILSNEYLAFYSDTLAINYNREIMKILSIQSSFIRALVRFFISHIQVNISFEDLLLALGVDESSDRYIRSLKKHVKDNAKILDYFGIKFDDYRLMFIYKQSKIDVKFVK